MQTSSPGPQAEQSTTSERARELAALRELRARKDWGALSEAAHAARTRLARGSNEWFEASALLAEALYQVWDAAELEELGGDVRRAVMESAGVEHGAPFPVLGRLGPTAAPHALDVYVLDAWAKQARGAPAAAIAELCPAPEILLHGHVRPSQLTLRAGLDLGRMHVALGRAEGPRMLAAVRDRFPESDAGTAAMVLLESLEGPGAYRGKYAGDGRHAARMAALQAALPRARARVAKALCISPEDLPAIPVGVADRPNGHLGEAA